MFLGVGGWDSWDPLKIPVGNKLCLFYSFGFEGGTRGTCPPPLGAKRPKKSKRLEHFFE